MAGSSTATQTRVALKMPSMWRVVLHNDDFTPVDFVVLLLQAVFHKTPEEAQGLAEHVHNKGRAQVGLYTKEIAITKTETALRLAEQHEHPLLTTAEEA
jgi:ATP-dependent Clp protease adaptor protein ClpS